MEVVEMLMVLSVEKTLYNKRTGAIDYNYFFNGNNVGSSSESGDAFENAIWDFGGLLNGMKQGEQGKKDQMIRYFLNGYYGNSGALPKIE